MQVHSCSSRPLSKAEKYNAACKQLATLSALMSDVGMREFMSMSDFLAKVILRFEAGKECVLLEDDDDVSTDHATGGDQDGVVVSDTEHVAEIPIHSPMQQLLLKCRLHLCPML